MHAVRGGSITGNHTVLFAGAGETIEITHRAATRDIFVHGAIAAAKFLSRQEAGFYTMDDVLS
jgi:4-hydroxy-tetrahydrodipicolinate reductase